MIRRNWAGRAAAATGRRGTRTAGRARGGTPRPGPPGPGGRGGGRRRSGSARSARSPPPGTCAAPSLGPGWRRSRRPRAWRPGRPGPTVGHREEQRVAADLLHLQPVHERHRRAGELLGQHHVEVAREHRLQGALRREVRDVEDQRAALEPREQVDHQAVGHRLERGEPEGSGRLPAGGGEVGLGALQAFQHRLGVLDEQQRLRRELHPSPDRLQQRHTRFPFEHVELVGDGRRAVAQRAGDGRQRAAVPQLPQQAEAMDVQHPVTIVSRRPRDPCARCGRRVARRARPPGCRDPRGLRAGG